MLKQQLKQDANGALKSRDQFTCGILRMALSSISAKEKEKRYKLSKEDSDIKEEDLLQAAVLNDDEIISVLSSEIKKRKDAIVLYEKGGRAELADNEKKEITVLQKYLPEQLSSEELEKLVKESIAKVGAKEIKDIGKVMADIMPKVKGKADNGEISKIIKAALFL